MHLTTEYPDKIQIDSSEERRDYGSFLPFARDLTPFLVRKDTHELGVRYNPLHEWCILFSLLFTPATSGMPFEPLSFRVHFGFCAELFLLRSCIIHYPLVDTHNLDELFSEPFRLRWGNRRKHREPV